MMEIISDPNDFESWKAICREPATRERTEEDVVEDDNTALEDVLADSYAGSGAQQRLLQVQQEKAARRNVDTSGAKELTMEYVDPRFNGFKMSSWEPFDWKAHGIDTPVVGQKIVLMFVRRSIRRPFDVDRAAWKKLDMMGRIMLCLLHGSMRTAESNDNRMFRVRMQAQQYAPHAHGNAHRNAYCDPLPPLAAPFLAVPILSRRFIVRFSLRVIGERKSWKSSTTSGSPRSLASGRYTWSRSSQIRQKNQWGGRHLTGMALST